MFVRQHRFVGFIEASRKRSRVVTYLAKNGSECLVEPWVESSLVDVRIRLRGPVGAKQRSSEKIQFPTVRLQLSREVVYHLLIPRLRSEC